MTKSHFTFGLHNGGQLVDLGDGLKYLGGMVVEGLGFDVDEWSIQELTTKLKEIGYVGNAEIWWCEEGVLLKGGLRELKSDRDAMRMGNFLISQDNKHCHVYAVSGFWQGTSVEITTNDEDYVPSDVDVEYTSGESGMIEVQVVSESESSSKEEIFDDSVDDCHHDDQFGFEVEGEDEEANAFGGFGGPLNEEENNVNGDVGLDGVAGADNDIGMEGLGDVGLGGLGGADGDAGTEGDVGDISSGYETKLLDSYDKQVQEAEDCGGRILVIEEDVSDGGGDWGLGGDTVASTANSMASTPRTVEGASPSVLGAMSLMGGRPTAVATWSSQNRRRLWGLVGLGRQKREMEVKVGVGEMRKKKLCWVIVEHQIP
ncbi:hypothetical protein PIB30_061730 [Stylosanthes scabra]|uniref:PB1-like domain-containing protein n=1 Tax=Stylosanthes scabra TaxID=79078 RepID=A0ABU6YMU0_9FABA|nr:hypothetical protein [Stylosanthes scabra]